MKVIGLNDKEYNLNLANYSTKREQCSYYHKLARELLQDMFKGYNIYEEIKLPGTVNPAKKSALHLDFFIPNAKLGIEVHGEQHFKYIPYFHKTKEGFLRSKARDRAKAEWCVINNINLIELRWDESLEYWRNKIECQR
jgi:hypothetical protein